MVDWRIGRRDLICRYAPNRSISYPRRPTFFCSCDFAFGALCHQPLG